MDRMMNWAILGTGDIANEMAQALKNTGRKVYAVGNRTHEKAVDFAKEYEIEKVYDNFHEMFQDDAVDVIYIATPHNTHSEFIMEAVSNGKHVLCEKAITLNSKELEKAINLAKEKNVVLAEAMTIYHMPLHKKLRKMVEEGGIGDIGMIQINFGSFKEYNMDNRFFNPKMAGGALLDIGVYAISLARYYLKSQPNQVVSIMKKAPSGVDEISGIVMQNAEGQMVVISLSLHTKQPKRCNICGENGYIEIVDYPRAEEAKIVYTESAKTEIVKEGEMSLALQYELEDMEKAILGNDDDILLDYTRDVMQIMTDLRKEWEMYYPEEIGKAAVSA
ncbi:Gfo/Idh/MocA family protein [Roseburia sp. 499]|uniref:Gfo/Idh/MocA family protein n=1 Tax=Roseburia sp. 499 TaxID=1261634 RepID=UPI000950DDAF|nr:Gfo/Idh/MocA family oxidoreductase [Roseburia sp. 499]WVK68555.1 Gfo/Idh/MocA family oxidoreductase [Roseburia sp. 499]